MKIHRNLILGASLLFQVIAYAQKIEQSLQKLNAEYRTEKIYLHLDKQAYLEEETIWFKAYLFSGNFPSQISNVLYIDLISADGHLLTQQILPLIQSGASGALQLPVKTSGAVTIRAYTKWMLNFDHELIYTRTVPVFTPGMPQSKLISAAKSSSAQDLLTFFPEGGSLVQGIESTVAFRAEEINGTPFSVSGKICNAAGDSITMFSATHDGMGRFRFKPGNGKYVAIWKKDGKNIETILPAAKTTGIVLNVKEQANALIFTVKRREDDLTHPVVILAAQMNQQLLYKTPVDLRNTNEISGRIALKNIPAGVIQLTVFSQDYQPLSERLAFGGIANFSSSVNLHTPDTYTGKRQSLKLSIQIPDTIVTNLSLSITDARLASGSPAEQIPASLLLTPDLKGEINQPGFYFSGEENAAALLDLVMMTHSWRGFRWEEILADKYPVIQNTPDQTLWAKGKLSREIAQAHPDKTIELMLKPTGGNIKMLTGSFDNDGNILLNDLFFYDSAALYIKTSKKKTIQAIHKNELSIKTNLSFIQPPAIRAKKFSPATDTATLAAYKKYNQWMDEVGYAKATTLQGVTIEGKRQSQKAQVDKQHSTGLFSGNDRGRIILPEDDPAFLSATNLYDFLRTREVGLQINPHAAENPIEWRGAATALFVDEVSQQSVSANGDIVEDASQIASLPMSEIAMVKLFPPPFAGAWGNGPGGAVAVYLKKGTNARRTQNNAQVWLKGFTQTRPFTFTDYTKENEAGASDTQGTILWMPLIILGKDQRRLTIPFNTGDAKDLRVLLEGCNEDGQLIHIEKIIRAD